MIKKRHIKNTGIIMGITILSCIISAASNTKDMAGSSVPDILNNNNKIYSNGLFNPSFRQAKNQEENTTPLPSPLPEETAKPDTTIKETITSSSVMYATENDITIKWDAMPEAEGYELNISYSNVNYTIETSDTTFKIPSLSAATICSYQIRYYKTILGEKTYSPMSVVFLASTTTSKVSGLSVTDRTASAPDTASIDITWDTMNDAIYKVYYKPSAESEYILSGETSFNTYTVEGLNASEKYDIYVQAYCLTEENTGEASGIISTYTCPASVSTFKIVSEESHSISLSWDANPTGSSYYIYRSVNDSEYELYKVSTETTLSETELKAGTVYSYKICSYLDKTNLISPASGPLRAVTTPYVTTGLALSGNTAESIQLSWNYNETATGYIIYRRKGSGDFEYLASTTSTSYTDTGLDSGKNYRYKIQTYADTEEHTSDFGDIQKTSTLPAQTELKGKAGYGKLRLSWKTVPGAAGYYIYQQSGDNYILINTIDNSKTVSIVYDNLIAGETYNYKVYSYRNAFDTEFVSEESAVSVTPRVTKGTTTTPSYYKTKKALINSDAWKNIPIVKKSANYSKSYTIPGIRSTNVNGFESTSMCPQGLTFAENYLLISAYDTYNEENSVIYVMDKTSKELLTVIVLPNKTHAGGITYDGENIWITNGQKICTIDFNEVDVAAQENNIFKNVNFTGTYNLGHKASFLAWHKNQIWTGNFEYTQNGKLRSYTITKTTGSGQNTTEPGNEANAGDTVNTEPPADTLQNGTTEDTTDPGNNTAGGNTDSTGNTSDTDTSTTENTGTTDETDNNTDNTDNSNMENITLTLTQQSCVTIPPAVQGVTFSGNKLILSRAYGYVNELNIYKPSNTGKTNMKTGKSVKTVKMPALNEEIAVLGNYIYVNFESAVPGSQALNHMDRVLAIKLKAVLK